MSSKTSDGNMMIPSNRSKFFKKLEINPKSVAEVKQVRGNKIVYVDKPLDPLTEADGLIANNKNLFLIVKVADCMPIALYDKKHEVIALLHVGYKGLRNSAIKNALDKMRETFGTRPKNITVNIGPSIGPCHYRMDIWKEAENQLIRSGVVKEKIENPRICTYESKDYFSHRKSGDEGSKDDPRFITILGLI
ncbi:MAG: laccase domain-containing protein [Candidatus Levybacteria bacterium]|nr:laccase domain-containing protein [Candidatus Levybacteria bacterium]